MKRNAISQWELSDHFWAESDPPEPCATGRSFLQRCARQLDRLTNDRKVKYRLAGRRRDTLPPEAARPYRVRRPPPVDQEFRGFTVGQVPGGRRTSHCSNNNTNYCISGKDDDCCKESHLTPMQQPPPPPLCVIKRSDDFTCATETFGTVPFREVSTHCIYGVVSLVQHRNGQLKTQDLN